MTFVDILRRYHIEPLQYSDGTELNERDYVRMYDILSKYFLMKRYFKDNISNVDFDEAVKKINFMKNNSLLPITEEDVMDMLEGIEENLVI